MPVTFTEKDYDAQLMRAINELHSEIDNLEISARFFWEDRRPRLMMARENIENACRWLNKEIERKG